MSQKCFLCCHQVEALDKLSNFLCDSQALHMTMNRSCMHIHRDCPITRWTKPDTLSDLEPRQKVFLRNSSQCGELTAPTIRGRFFWVVSWIEFFRILNNSTNFLSTRCNFHRLSCNWLATTSRDYKSRRTLGLAAFSSSSRTQILRFSFRTILQNRADYHSRQRSTECDA